MAWLAKKMFRISGKRAIQLFRCNASSFGDKFRDVRSYRFKRLSQREYARLRREWKVLANAIKHGPQNTFRATVTLMRLKLAKIMLASLDPDLVILDEFQRFKDILMSPDSDEKNLCSTLLRTSVPTLLLSATPYRLFGRGGRMRSPDEADPYKEFKKTLEFLTCDVRLAGSLISRIWDYEKTVGGLTDDTWRDRLQSLLKEKRLLEKDLTKFMSRTERVFFQHEEINPVETKFLSELAATDRITKDEIKEYLALAQHASRKEVLGYWKSGSHLISYLQEYVLGRMLRRNRAIAGNPFLYTNLKGGDARSRKLEYLAKDVFKTPASTLYLWIPPLAPYYPGRGIFSPDSVRRAGVKKGLVFSAWKFVPRLVAAELSSRRDALFRRKFVKYQMRVTPVTWASFFFPSKELATLLTHDDFSQCQTYDALKALALAKLREKIVAKDIRIRVGTKSAKPWELLRQLEYSDHEDRWKQLIQSYKKKISRSRQNDEHNTLTLIDPRYLNYLNKPFTADLLVNPQCLEQLAEIAIASPAVTIFRAVLTVAGPDAEKFQDEIGQLCMIELRSFIGRSTTVQCVKAAYKRGSYGRRIAEYFRDGNIQAVLDEYLFCVAGEFDQKRFSEKQMTELLYKLRSVFQHRKSVLMPFKGRRSRHRVNTHIAMAFGESQSEGVSRDDLRIAFNSPFWPFVLATTSVGQEGLDFHLYCKDIYHWNLPSNPVDFEQREGRLNRYNSLTVRDAIVSFGLKKIKSEGVSWWRRAFEKAHEYCHYNDRYNLGLSPNWICTPLNRNSRSRLIRHILDLPHGSDRHRYHELMDQLRLYRLALGQPNPDSYLRDLEKNGFLKSIDTRSLYLNLFPFRAVDHQSQLQHILQRQDSIELLLSDAKKKASQLEKTTGIAFLKRLVGKSVETVRKNLKDDYPKTINRLPLKTLIGAILKFIEVHDAINDRVPAWGYQDDRSRLEAALQLHLRS
jgi:hypothetical protein